ncbi:MAG: hypothetical protein M3Y53_03330 [Thermoproteota archaeon]|nr:hypothetical protein [Thermoproteota archaeon]
MDILHLVLVRRWNAKECYLDQPMTTAAPKNVDSHLGISGDNGGLKITVAKEGMIWTGNETPRYA